MVEMQFDIAGDLRTALRERSCRDEALVKSLLGRWVSELEPAVACDKRGSILGLALADAPPGSKPFILRPA